MTDNPESVIKIEDLDLFPFTFVGAVSIFMNHRVVLKNKLDTFDSDFYECTTPLTDDDVQGELSDEQESKLNLEDTLYTRATPPIPDSTKNISGKEYIFGIRHIILPFEKQMEHENALKFRLRGATLPELAIDNLELANCVQCMCEADMSMRYYSYEEVLQALVHSIEK